MAVVDREILRAAAVERCGRDPMRVVRRTCGIETLAGLLVGATQHVRQLIEDFRTSSRNPFPNWTAGRPALRATEASSEMLAI